MIERYVHGVQTKTLREVIPGAAPEDELGVCVMGLCNATSMAIVDNPAEIGTSLPKRNPATSLGRQHAKKVINITKLRLTKTVHYTHYHLRRMRMNTALATLRTWQKKLVLVGSIITLTVATLLPFAPMKVGASGCHIFGASTYLQQYESGGNPYMATSTFTVPSTSSCHDIQIDNAQGGDGTFRVRFYPSSGGSYLGAPINVRVDQGYVILAYNVLDGTHYRIERVNATDGNTLFIMD